MAMWTRTITYTIKAGLSVWSIIRVIREVTEGEKVLGQGVAFYKTYYVTTFTPNDDPCTPGGNAKLYAIDYKTGAAVIKFTDTDGDGDKDLTSSIVLGGGIPSKTVVTVITSAGQKLSNIPGKHQSGCRQ